MRFALGNLRAPRFRGPKSPRARKGADRSLVVIEGVERPLQKIARFVALHIARCDALGRLITRALASGARPLSVVGCHA